MFRHHLLGLLRRGGARHGYALAKEYDERTGLRHSAGNFYRELQRLADDGLVQRVPNRAESDRRRAPYEITAQGELAFEEWFGGARLSSSCPESELAVRAVFLSDVSPDLRDRLLEGWRRDLLDVACELEGELRRADAEAAPPAHGPALLVRRRLRHVEAELAFLDDLRSAYGEGRVAASR